MYQEGEKIIKSFTMEEKILIERKLREYLESHARTDAVKAFDTLSLNF